MLVKQLRPLSYASVLRNEGATPLHLALCNDSLYFEAVFVRVADLQQPAHQQHGAGDAACGGVSLPCETIATWSTGCWYALDLDLIGQLGIAMVPCGRLAPALQTVEVGGDVLVVVRPRASEVAGWRALRKHKYIQEMVRIYNRENLSEKCSLTLSISLGHVDTFFVPPGSKSTSAFSILERSVVSFLR